MNRRMVLGGSALACLAAGAAWRSAWSQEAAVPDEILNPVEAYGEEAVPVLGRLPGKQRMYFLPDKAGETHRIGSFIMTRIARGQETADGYEAISFRGPAGSSMPPHVRLQSHAALLVMEGDVEVYLDGRRYRMLKGDFANVPTGAVLGWTNRSDRGYVTLFTTGNRVGRAYAAMGAPATSNIPPANAIAITPGQLALASLAGDFQLRQGVEMPADMQRPSNLLLPDGRESYVLMEGGGERFGGNTFLAKNRNTNGQFLFLITEGGSGPGIGAHFHARHTEDFYGMDGETLAWAYGKAVSLKTGDFIQAPPRHLHGFRMTQPYNRFAAFLTPGIFETFFTRGGNGRNGVGGRGGGEGAPPAPPRGRGDGPRPGAGDPGVDMFRALSMSGRGPDGYPLDVHGATRPLPPEDPIWKKGPQLGLNELKFQYLQHAVMCAGGRPYSEPISPALAAVLKLKPKAETFI